MGKWWYKTSVYANLDAMEYYGHPLIPDNYQTPDENLAETLINQIIHGLTEEEQDLIHERYYFRNSLRQIAANLNHTSHGVTQHKLRKVVAKVRRELIERIERHSPQ